MNTLSVWIKICRRIVAAEETAIKKGLRLLLHVGRNRQGTSKKRAVSEGEEFTKGYFIQCISRL